MTQVIYVCETCAGGQGPALMTALRAALAEAGLAFDLRGWPCMNACARAQTLAVRAPGKAAYLFGEVTVGDVTDIVGFARLYDAAPDGWIEDARAAGRLRHCLIGRIPA